MTAQPSLSFQLCAHPRAPAHLGRSCCNTGGESPPASFAPIMQDAHHDTRPAIPHALRSVAHEPWREPCRLSCGGSHRREHDCHHACFDNGHAHIDDVPGHHRHVTARHSTRLMLHCTPRCRICRGRVPSCHPACTASPARVGACLVSFAYAATLFLCPMDICLFIMERAAPTLI